MARTTDVALPHLVDVPPPVVTGEPVELSDGIFVIRDRRAPLVPNVGIVVGQNATLVIDTGVGPRNGAFVLEQARKLSEGRPIYLTITHFHPEHGFGAQAFKGAATIVYNRVQRDELRRKGMNFVEMLRGFGPVVAAELEGVELVDPDITYEGEAELDLGGHRAVLNTWGAAHTAGDQTVFVDGKVLFCGDLAKTRMFPITPHFPPHDVDADADNWITVLDQLIALDPQIVVPGHAEVADVEMMRDVRGFLEHVRHRTHHLFDAGTSLEDAAATVEADARTRWSTWANPEMIGLVVRSFHDAKSASAGLPTA
jgi:glyoxylase-like metal-dependent hydrolase (beta-lactamase superfamily II)